MLHILSSDHTILMAPFTFQFFVTVQVIPESGHFFAQTLQQGLCSIRFYATKEALLKTDLARFPLDSFFRFRIMSLPTEICTSQLFLKDTNMQIVN